VSDWALALYSVRFARRLVLMSWIIADFGYWFTTLLASNIKTRHVEFCPGFGLFCFCLTNRVHLRKSVHSAVAAAQLKNYVSGFAY